MMNTATNEALSVGAGPCDVPLLEETIGRVFDRTAGQFPDNPGLIVRHQGVHWSYAEYRRQTGRFLPNWTARRARASTSEGR